MASIDILSLNIEQGGYDRRHVFDNNPTDEERVPEREAALKALIESQHSNGVDTAALIDTYGWRERYGTDEAIARHLGFRAAAFIELADDRVDRIYGPGAGSTFATDHPVDEIRPLDLDDRQGIRAIITPGGTPVQIAECYFTDIDESRRLIQLRAGLNGLEDLPTLFVGDLNSLRPDMKGAPLPVKLHDLGFRGIALAFGILPKQETVESLMTKLNKSHLAPKVDYYHRAVTNINQRTVIPALQRAGFQDSDPKKQPTFYKFMRIGLGVDYIFARGLQTEDFRVVPTQGASDHDGVRTRAHI